MNNFSDQYVEPNHKSNFIQLITMASFVLFCYFLFNNYAKGGNIGWVIAPSIFMIVMMILNLKTSMSTINISLTIAIILVSISLFLSAHKIRNKSEENNGETLIYQTEIKYLVATIMFTLTVLFTMSPLGDWIAGGNDKAMYSKNFLFIYGIICFALYIMFDTIRHYNLFDLNQVIFGEKSDPNQTKYGIVIAICLWLIYSLLVFEGIQFVGTSTSFDSRHFITIAILTLAWLIFTFTYSQKVNSDCKTWQSKDAKNDFQEIYVNVISSTIVLLLLTLTDRIVSF